MFHVKQNDRSLGLKTNKRSYLLQNNEYSVVLTVIVHLSYKFRNHFKKTCYYV